MQTFKYLVIWRYRYNAGLLPCGDALFGCMTIYCLVFVGNGAAQVLKQYVGYLASQLPRILTLGVQAIGLCLCEYLLCTLYINRGLTFSSIFQRKHTRPASCSVACRACRKVAQQVARRYQVGISTTHAPQGFLCYAARPHEAVLTTGAGYTEVTLWLLTVKTVEHCLYTHFLHVEQHLPDSRIGCLLYLLLLIGKRLAVFRHSRHIVLCIAVYVWMFGVMVMMRMACLMRQYLLIGLLA